MNMCMTHLNPDSIKLFRQREPKGGEDKSTPQDKGDCC